MAIQIEYGNGVVVLPAKAAEVMQNAEKSDLAVLLALLADASLCARYGQADAACAIAQAAGCSEQAVASAVAFWRGAGVISVCAPVSEPSAEALKRVAAPIAKQPQAQPVQAEPTPDGAALLKKSDDLPKYTTAELGNLLEQRPDTAELLTECQNLFGKLFSTYEFNIMLGLTDYLGLSAEYVLLLATNFCNWSRGNGARPSVRAFEKLAVSMFDRGIVDFAALEVELARMEQVRSVENKLRHLFGIGARALSAKEKKAFADWVHTYQYDMEMITLAFEAGADASTDVSVPYVNSILKRWHAAGIRTPADVEADKQASDAAKDKGKGKKATEQQGGSFDTDDFFEAAMRRSLGENYDKIVSEG